MMADAETRRGVELRLRLRLRLVLSPRLAVCEGVESQEAANCSLSS